MDGVNDIDIDSIISELDETNNRLKATIASLKKAYNVLNYKITSRNNGEEEKIEKPTPKNDSLNQLSIELRDDADKVAKLTENILQLIGEQ